MTSTKNFLRAAAATAVILFTVSFVSAQTSFTLLALAKSDHTVAIVDPATLKILATLPSGPDPHEIIASDDGKFAYISNYGGLDSDLHTISVIDLITRQALPPIDLGPLHSAHGLAFAGGKLYFTAETNKVIGRYDPADQHVDWILGTGQDRTHMVSVSQESRAVSSPQMLTLAPSASSNVCRRLSLLHPVLRRADHNKEIHQGPVRDRVALI